MCGTLAPVFVFDGNVTLNGQRIDALPTEQRRVGILFQDDLLFAHMTVRENLLFAVPPGPRVQREAAVTQALADLELPWAVSRELFAFRSDNDLAQIAAIRAGVGVGACQHQIARRYGLTPLLSNAFGFELEVWIAMHENLKGHRRMRLMFDHLVAGFQAFIAEGRGA